MDATSTTERPLGAQQAPDASSELPKMRSPTTKKFHSIKNKLKMIKLVESGHSKHSVAKAYNVQRLQPTRWMTDKTWFKKVKNKRQKKTLHPGHPIAHPELEDSMHQWILERRQAGVPVLYRTIFRELLRRNPNFCGAKYNALGLLSNAFFVARSFPFKQYMHDHAKKHPYPLGMIGNMDQTPIWWDMVSEYTIDKVGQKKIWIRTSAKEKQRITVTLAVLADGTKLPPVVIFAAMPDGNLAKNARTGKALYDTLVRWQKSSWVDESEALWWTENVWLQGHCKTESSFLIFDALRSQYMPAIKTLFNKSNSTPCVIPGGMTSILQPLDVSINKVFKRYYKDLYFQWLMTDAAFKADGVTPDSPSRLQIITWVKTAWEQIPADII
ncbi:DDE superfamily endonuclease-domain-containing protein [Phlyctochytrium arcticum]|nr:DDE superfamily endonuclease-domain-containing protein [Phlyctochytrium arcticum]